MTDRHVVAIGGGGFSEALGVITPIDRFLLSLAASARPRVCFVATASGDGPLYVERFYAAFTQEPCVPSHLKLFGPPYPRIPDRLIEQDVVYVGGGSTANMLAVWRLHGVDEALREAWEAGVVLCGISAGSLCWFEGGVTDSFGPLRAMPDGLGFIPGSNSRTTTPSRVVGRRTSGPWRTACSRPASRPTTASRCISSGRSSSRWCPSGPASGPIGSSETATSRGKRGWNRSSSNRQGVSPRATRPA
jgi:peptidase E